MMKVKILQITDYGCFECDGAIEFRHCTDFVDVSKEEFELLKKYIKSYQNYDTRYILIHEPLEIENIPVNSPEDTVAKILELQRKHEAKELAAQKAKEKAAKEKQKKKEEKERKKFEEMKKKYG